jgi:hypothetical protein
MILGKWVELSGPCCLPPLAAADRVFEILVLGVLNVRVDDKGEAHT